MGKSPFRRSRRKDVSNSPLLQQEQKKIFSFKDRDRSQSKKGNFPSPSAQSDGSNAGLRSVEDDRSLSNHSNHSSSGLGASLATSKSNKSFSSGSSRSSTKKLISRFFCGSQKGADYLEQDPSFPEYISPVNSASEDGTDVNRSSLSEDALPLGLSKASSPELSRAGAQFDVSERASSWPDSRSAGRSESKRKTSLSQTSESSISTRGSIVIGETDRISEGNESDKEHSSLEPDKSEQLEALVEDADSDSGEEKSDKNSDIMPVANRYLEHIQRRRFRDSKKENIPESPVQLVSNDSVDVPASPDPGCDLFLPTSSSSISEESSNTFSEQSQILHQKNSGRKSVSPLPSPLHIAPSIVMKSDPGKAIPTPLIKQNHEEQPFPHPLASMPESVDDSFETPSIVKTLARSFERSFSASPPNKISVPTPRKNQSNAVNESLDESAFLPNEFRQFSWDDVQRLIREAKDETAQQMESKYEEALGEFQKQAERMLQEQGDQWKRESEEEAARLSQRLEVERAKNSEVEALRAANSDLEEKIQDIEIQRSISGSPSDEKEDAEREREAEEQRLREEKLKEAKEKECNDLRSQISQLQNNYESYLKRVQTDEETKTAETEEKIKSSEKERDVLQLQLKQLREEHEAALKQIQADAEIKAAETEERIQASEKECSDLRTQVQQLQEEHEVKLKQMQADEESKAIETEAKIKSLQEEHQTRSLDFEQKTISEKSELESRIQELQAQHVKELEEEKSKAAKELETAQTNLREALELYESSEQKFTSAKEEYIAEIARLKEEHENKLSAALAEAKAKLEKELEPLEAQISLMQSDDNEMLEKIASLEAKTESDRENFDLQISEIRAGHAKEIEELIGQLDLIEAEHNERYAVKEKMVREKDAVISALGSQLAETQSRMKALEDQTDVLKRDYDACQVDLSETLAEIEHQKQSLQELNTRHKAAMAAEIVARKEACEAAREEMIERAEAQFDEANATYKKLKHEYDTVTLRVAALEEEIDAARSEAFSNRKQYEKREADFEDELAHAKASYATLEADASRKAKQHRYDLERLEGSMEDMRAKLDETAATSRTLQNTLVSVVKEKEDMVRENDELKNVCEELMAMVEKGDA